MSCKVDSDWNLQPVCGPCVCWHWACAAHHYGPLDALLWGRFVSPFSDLHALPCDIRHTYYTVCIFQGGGAALCCTICRSCCWLRALLPNLCLGEGGVPLPLPALELPRVKICREFCFLPRIIPALGRTPHKRVAALLGTAHTVLRMLSQRVYICNTAAFGQSTPGYTKGSFGVPSRNNSIYRVVGSCVQAAVV